MQNLAEVRIPRWSDEEVEMIGEKHIREHREWVDVLDICEDLFQEEKIFGVLKNRNLVLGFLSDEYDLSGVIMAANIHGAIIHEVRGGCRDGWIFDMILCRFEIKEEIENFVGHVWLRHPTPLHFGDMATYVTQQNLLNKVIVRKGTS
jgi:hypothetical protein